ncbi:hypothetical protein [Spartinivicinus ruber]|uniref:hypothetical protein n=1 Tax=Spartinivicinus ruber TaxID=2683272 RepID=UPI0013D1E7E0|nr:hypothetical protein [Spartinivicinus ruber]
MNREKADGILSGVSSVLDSLGNLAEKGTKLKQAVHGAENQSSAGDETLQQLTTQLEETDTGLKLTISTTNLAKAKVDVKIQDNVLRIKVVKGQYIAYKDIELTPGAHIDNINLDNDAGHIEIHYS